MKNVAVTGISGYLGTLLGKRLAQEPDVQRIIGLDVWAPSFESPKLTFIRHDVSQPFADVFTQYEIDTAIHLAFIVLPVHNAPRTFRVNIGGSQNFLDACTAAGVESVYYMGSNTEYGAFRDNPPKITEETPIRPNPDYPYACDKARVDRLFQDFAARNPKVCVTIGRTAPVTGPCGDACGLTALFLPVMVKAAGRNPDWQFIHEEDLAELVLRLVKGKHGGIYNLAADGALAYAEMIKKLKRPCLPLPSWLLYRGVQLAWRLRLQGRSQPGGLVMLQYPICMSNDKVKNATGYAPRHTGPEAFNAFLNTCGK